MTPEEASAYQAKKDAELDAWFAQLQSLTTCKLDVEDWTERWFDGYTPKEALEVVIISAHTRPLPPPSHGCSVRSAGSSRS